MNVKGFLVLFFCFSLLFINAQSDTLYVDENNQDISKTIYIKNNKERKYMYSFAHEHYNTHKGFVLAHKICKNRYRKFKKIAQVLHFYNINNGHPEQYKGHVWYKDYSSLLKKLFLSGYLHSRVIIIRPNGEFFLGYHNHYLFRDVVKNRKWEKSKSEFKNKLEELNQYNQ